MADGTGAGTKPAPEPMPQAQAPAEDEKTYSALSVAARCAPAFAGTMLAAFTVGNRGQSTETSAILLGAQLLLYVSSVYLWIRFLHRNS